MEIKVPMQSVAAVAKTATTRASISEWRKVVAEYGLKIKPAPMLHNVYHIEGVVLPHSGDRPRLVELTVDNEGNTYISTDAFTKKDSPIPFASIKKEAKRLLAYHVKYSASMDSESAAGGKAKGGVKIERKVGVKKTSLKSFGPKRKTAESVQADIDKLVHERKVISAKITELREELRSLKPKR